MEFYLHGKCSLNTKSCSYLYNYFFQQDLCSTNGKPYSLRLLSSLFCLKLWYSYRWSILASFGHFFLSFLTETCFFLSSWITNMATNPCPYTANSKAQQWTIFLISLNFPIILQISQTAWLHNTKYNVRHGKAQNVFICIFSIIELNINLTN